MTPTSSWRSGTAKSGATVAENDDKVSGNTNSEISQSLAAGTYTIEATTYPTATTGSFTLTVSGLSGTGGGTPTACAVNQTLSPGLQRLGVHGHGASNGNDPEFTGTTAPPSAACP